MGPYKCPKINGYHGYNNPYNLMDSYPYLWMMVGSHLVVFSAFFWGGLCVVVVFWQKYGSATHLGGR